MRHLVPSCRYRRHCDGVPDRRSRGYSVKRITATRRPNLRARGKAGGKKTLRRRVRLARVGPSDVRLTPSADKPKSRSRSGILAV
jgi:hypothetical protein